MTFFIGRQHELKQLNLLFKKESASLIVIQGRRRIGKSRLVEEFAKPHKFIRISGIPPTDSVTDQDQRNTFMYQLAQQIQTEWNPQGWQPHDWSALFTLLADQTKTGRVIILLDEISWMGSLDPTFLGKLKTAWDHEFKKNPKLIMVLCGSVSTWIEKNIIKNTGFFGRISQYFDIKELPLPDCAAFFDKIKFAGTSHEKLKILSTTGGVPWYLEQIQAGLNADDNIRNLCFRPNSALVYEFDLIFHDLFSKRSAIYKRIIETLADGSKELNEIYTLLGYQKSGIISTYLDDLEKAGFIQRDHTWKIKTQTESKLSHFRLSDNYLRFYLKQIEPRLNQIKKDALAKAQFSSISGWESIIGLQVENLILNNRQLIWDKLDLNAADIIFDNPYFQKKSATQDGCQIDYLIQTKFNLIYVCEIKFSRNTVGASVISDVKSKIDKIKIPKGYAYTPVLIHMNGVSDQLLDQNYFSHIIDINDLMKAP